MSGLPNDSLAPLLIFAHRRPWHLRSVLDAVARDNLARFTSVTIHVDGPRNWLEKIQVYRTILEGKRPRPFLSCKVVSRKANLGLARSVVGGVTEKLQAVPHVIVLEDDIVPQKGFLEYMNQALDIYGTSRNVLQISGFRPPGRSSLTQEVQFSPLTTSWGWATWRRAWNKFKMKISVPRDFPSQKKRFNFDGSYPFDRLLMDAIHGKSQSWAIRWYYACYQMKGLTVYPPSSYVENIGLDGSGEHGRKVGPLKTIREPVSPEALHWPRRIQTSRILEADFKRYFRSSGV